VTVALRPDEQRRLAELRERHDRLTTDEADEWHQLRAAAIPRTVEPYYSLAEQTVIPLYAGPLLYPPHQERTAEQVDGTVALQMAPVPQILMRGAVSRQFQLHDLLDGERALQLPPMVAVPDAPEASSETGNASWRGPVGGYVVGKAAAVRRVTFHLVNFMPMVGAIITDGVNAWAGRVTVNVGPWVVTIDACPDLEEVLAAVGEHGGHAVTHTCSLERRDRRPFAFARCQELLTCLTWCLWFCRAAAPSVVVPVGFDTNDRATWSRWAAPHTDPLPDHHGQWFDKAYGAEQLATLLPLFWQRYSDPLWQRSLQLAIRNYADAAVMGTLQRNVILPQVGLESLAYAHLVRSSQQLQPKQFTHPVSQHIRRFLRDVGIPTTIPRTFYGLRRVRANSPWDGPAAVAWLRNDIVHANRHWVDGRRWKVWYQGWRLAVWYLELAVLAVVGYEGRYRNRLSDEVDAGAVESVPWAVMKPPRGPHYLHRSGA
jgi:hypothetical protein